MHNMKALERWTYLFDGPALQIKSTLLFLALVEERECVSPLLFVDILI